HVDGGEHDGNTHRSSSGRGIGGGDSTLVRSEDVPEVKSRVRIQGRVNAASSSSSGHVEGNISTSPKGNKNDHPEVHHIENAMSGTRMVDPGSHHRDSALEEGYQEAETGSGTLSLVRGQLERYKQSVHQVQNERSDDEVDTDSLFDYAEAMRQISRSEPHDIGKVQSIGEKKGGH
ncbi:hypothetical protein LTR40_007021, partial [Exophiala xenobiotica]